MNTRLSFAFIALLAAVSVLPGCDGGEALSAGEAAAGGSGIMEDARSSEPAPESVPNPESDAAAVAAPQAVDTAQELTRSRETAVVRAAERLSPAVVAVNVLRTEQVRTRDPFWDDFFPFFGGFRGPTTERRVPSLGSGFIVDPSGIILTNDHVVRGAERILVTFADGRDAEAELIGSDEATDVAVIRVGVTDLPTAPIGSTHDLRIGEWVIAFGNPFGHLLSNPEPTVTVGVTSAVERHIVPTGEDRGFYLGMIQTDAAINPGNSGGPLANANGEVVGMNASIFSRGGGSEGLGFAIPIERVLRIAEDILEHGEVRRAWLGVNVEPEAADAFGRTRGVRAARVVEGSPAARAGVRAGERIEELNGRRLVTPLDFEAALLDLRAGDRVSLRIAGRDQPLELAAVELPSLNAERVRVLRDLEIVTLTAAIRAERDVESEAGALVTGISQQLQGVLDLRPGDVIVALNNRAVRSAEDLSALLDQIPPGSRVRLYFERNRGYVARDFILGR